MTIRKKKTQEEFMAELTAELIRTGDLENYDLSGIEYESDNTKILVKCLKHSLEMWVRPSDWLRKGARCNTCGRERQMAKRRSNIDDLIIKANLIHNNKYDYSKFVYLNNHTPGIVICAEHGEFMKDMANHISGKKGGCPYCSGRRSILPKKDRIKREDLPEYFSKRFLDKAVEIHGNRYDYSKVSYAGNKTKVVVVCKLHGDFLVTPGDHISKRSNCPSCYPRESAAELEIRTFIHELGFETVNNVAVLDRKHIDILIPSKSIGVEYCGLYWHSEQERGKSYHFDKYILAKEMDIQLIQIFSDEWINKREIVENMLRYKLGAEKNILAARKTKFVRIDNTIASSFYELTHIQGGRTPLSTSVGLTYNSELIACMSFSITDLSKGVVTLTRYSSKGGVQGGFSKLLVNSIPILKALGINLIISFSDNRFGNGRVYSQNGFIIDHLVKYDYYWVKNNIRFHKMDFRRSRLEKKTNFDFLERESESENCIRNGYYKIYDAGKIRWDLSI